MILNCILNDKILILFKKRKDYNDYGLWWNYDVLNVLF